MRITGDHRGERQGAVMGTAGMAGIWWRTSSHSGGDNNCVEVGATGESIAVRDSKDRHGGALRFSASQWQSFTENICPPPAPA
jgi:hypothetical protein